MKMDEFYKRRAGVLLHPTSLPSGRLDRDVERWLDFLQQSHFQLWQVLPLGEPQSGLSPYQCVSAFSLNPALLNDYPKMNLQLPEFLDFCKKNEVWLDDYALFKVLKNRFADASWYDWPESYKHRDAVTLAESRKKQQTVIDELRWQQYCLSARWQEIKKRAGQKNILLFGDVPIFVAHDSVDVWVCPERYLLDENGKMAVNTGVPPDYFSDTGQSWGNPHYNWEMMAQENFSWWIERLSYHFELFDLVRIDHFRGLEAVWMINADSDTAVDGYYQKVPGDALLQAVKEKTGQLPIVAEDLGIITEEVVALRKKFHLPGMSVLQFGFDEHDDNPHKVKNILPDSVVYTGTHDNETTLGWYLNLDVCMRKKVMDSLHISYQHTDNNPEGEPSADYQNMANKVVDQMMVAALQSRASLCVFPLQDCLHLDNSAKMNTPGTIENNWCWQFGWQQINVELSERLKLWIKHSQRQVEDVANSKI